VSLQSQLVKTATKTPLVVFVREQADNDKVKQLEALDVEVVRLAKRDLKSILEQLGSRSIQSVLIEGGAEVSGSLLDEGLVNKVSFFIAPKIVGGSTAPSAVGGIGVERMSEAFQLENVEVSHHGDDIEVTGYPRAGKE
jgi:diaminohydroxyphosphoribosylaminopyrimidine deaminase/5-amino-6-(5-phosphoribosylamino)uracil reductase